MASPVRGSRNVAARAGRAAGSPRQSASACLIVACSMGPARRGTAGADPDAQECGDRRTPRAQYADPIDVPRSDLRRGRRPACLRPHTARLLCSLRVVDWQRSIARLRDCRRACLGLRRVNDTRPLPASRRIPTVLTACGVRQRERAPWKASTRPRRPGHRSRRTPVRREPSPPSSGATSPRWSE